MPLYRNICNVDMKRFVEKLIFPPILVGAFLKKPSGNAKSPTIVQMINIPRYKLMTHKNLHRSFSEVIPFLILVSILICRYLPARISKENQSEGCLRLFTGPHCKYRTGYEVIKLPSEHFGTAFYHFA